MTSSTPPPRSSSDALVSDAELLNILLTNGGAVAIAGLVIWRLAASIDRFTAKVDALVNAIHDDAAQSKQRIASLEEDRRHARHS